MLVEGSGSEGCRAGGQVSCGTHFRFVSVIGFDNTKWSEELLCYPDSVPFFPSPF